jgi:hypothetical protein
LRCRCLPLDLLCLHMHLQNLSYWFIIAGFENLYLKIHIKCRFLCSNFLYKLGCGSLCPKHTKQNWTSISACKPKDTHLFVHFMQPETSVWTVLGWCYKLTIVLSCAALYDLKLQISFFRVGTATPSFFNEFCYDVWN